MQETLLRQGAGSGVGYLTTPTRDRVSCTAAVRIDAWLIGACVVALIVRLSRLGASPLWLDETTTAEWIRLPWGAMLRTVLADNHPPLYFLLLKAWSLLAGESAWALRLPSVCFSWATVPLIAAAAGVLAGRAVRRWAAWLTALSPYLLQHAQEARMYSLLAALAALHFFFLARFITGATQRLGPSFVVTAVLLAATHYYAVFFLGAEVLVLLILHRAPVRGWYPAAATTAVIAVATLGIAAVCARRSAGGMYDPRLLTPLALPGAMWSMLSGYALLPSASALHFHEFAAVRPYLPIALGAVVPLCFVLVGGLRSLSVPARVLVGISFGAVLIGPFLTQVVMNVGMNPRYVTAGAPALLTLLAAAAADRVQQARSAWSLTAILVIMVIGSVVHLTEPGHGREDIRAASVWLDHNVPVGEEILITSEELAQLAQFHWPARHFRLYPTSEIVVHDGDAERVADELPFSGRRRVVYMVGREWLSDPDAALQRALTQRYTACPGIVVRDIRILCFLSPNGTSAVHAPGQKG